MRKLIALLAGLSCFISNGQTIAELYNEKDYQSVIQHESDADKLTPLELYMVGFSFFQLENDDKALGFYDRAITKGLDSAYVHYYKALSLRYAKRYSESVSEFDTALKKDPKNQMYMSEKGFVYYYSNQLDKALTVFLEAQKLPNTYQVPHYIVPHIYQMNSEYDKALKCYNDALLNISKDNTYYIKTLADIGLIQYVIKKDFIKSADAYSEAIKLDPKNYEFYTKLIKAYNASKEYSKADSVFDVMKLAYHNNELPEAEMEFKNTAIYEFQWNGQTAIVHRYFTEPKEVLDISYKIYLLEKSGDKVERTFMIEKTIQLPDSSRHLLCENDKKNGLHLTYPYGWKTDTISVDDIEKAVRLILDRKMKQNASSKSGN